MFILKDILNHVNILKDFNEDIINQFKLKKINKNTLLLTL